MTLLGYCVVKALAFADAPVTLVLTKTLLCSLKTMQRLGLYFLTQLYPNPQYFIEKTIIFLMFHLGCEK